MKVCPKCDEVKNLELFSKRKDGADGLRKNCKKCESRRAILWQKSNPVKYAENRRKLNKEKLAKKQQRYYLLHKEQERIRRKKYIIENRHKVYAYVATRRSSKLQATPQWANKYFIEEAYDLALLRTKMLGFKWHVDHVVPLQSNTVCGLHVEHNLQVIPGADNLSKGNRLWPDMP